MGLIVCHDCEREIGESAPVCPHCGAAQTEQTRRQGARRRKQIILHGSSAVFFAALAAVLAGLLSNWLGVSDESLGIAIVVSGIIGFVAGSVLGYSLTDRFI